MMGTRGTLSLPLRLTVIYGLLVVAALVIVIGLTVRLTHVYLTRELDYRLLGTAQEFQNGPARRVRDAVDLEREARLWLATRATAPDEVVAVRTTSGTVLTGAGTLDLRQVPGVRELLTAASPQWRILTGPTGRIRVVAVPLVFEGRQVGTLMVAASKDRLRATLWALSTRSILAGVVALIVALVLGYTAVRRSLLPLDRMLREIEAIQARGDLSRRIGQIGPADEVGRLSDAFDRMLDRLEEAFRLQQRFVSDASHELRTPLAVARGHLELLQQELTSASAGRSLGIVTEELDRMARIVDDLLLLARLDEGMTLARRPVDVELVIREAQLRTMLLAPRQIRVDAPPGVYALADPDRLLQVLTNLTTNAAMHGGADARITLTSRRETGQVTITVSDTGPGIAPDELPRVFDRFYRGAHARSSSSGVGLGLAIADSLIRAMGGEITVISEPGIGTDFVIRLPAAETPAEAALPAVS